MADQSPITLNCTQTALQYIQKKLTAKPNAIGLRIWLKKAGCSGWLYQFDYSLQAEPDEISCILREGLVVFLQRENLSFFQNAIIDYVQTGFDGMLTCINPNEVTRCGCGESFTIAREKSSY